jgi:hypothetical protein
MDLAGALALVHAADHPIMIRRHWKIEKYLGDFKEAKDIPKDLKPYATVDFEGNVLLNEGINELWTLVAGTGATKFDSGNAYIGIGDSSATPTDPTLTGLQAATNKLYKAMDSSYPTYGSSQKATWRSTFGVDDANWAWNEITVANGGSNAAKNLNRKVQAMGTKASGTTWVCTLEITVT